MPAPTLRVPPLGVLWLASGGAAPAVELLTLAAAIKPQGDMRIRVIAGAPSATGTYRLDLAIASFALVTSLELLPPPEPPHAVTNTLRPASRTCNWEADF